MTRDRGKPTPATPIAQPWLPSPPARVVVPAIGLVLAAYLLLVYLPGLKLPFLNDDYVFLDKVRGLSFLDLWKPEGLFSGWYRPWSREVHYWTIGKVAGFRVAPYHAVSFGLWLAAMLLHFQLVRRIAGNAAAAIATAGLAGLALWSAPLLWVAGAQDLWMLVFGLLYLHGVARGRIEIAAPALLLALLSKETAAALPGIAFGYVWLVEGRTPGDAARRTAWAWLVLLAWFLLHPTLRDRLLTPGPVSTEAQARPGPAPMLLRTLLAQFNLEARLLPETGWGAALLRAAPGAALLGLGAFLLARLPLDEPPERPTDSRDRGAIAFGALWASFGWAPLFLPSIGWHAYYGVLGSLGFWLVVGVILRRRLPAAILLIVLVATLREAHAATPSLDWGSAWYQKRAGSFLGAIRDRLRELHPDLPPHSRLFFARLPNDIGMLGGNAPALRIWYDDPTLTAAFYSAYAPRDSAAPAGRDYFLRYDSLEVLVEVPQEGRADGSSPDAHAGWRHDQAVLATLFLERGNPRGAAGAYARLWRGTPDRPEYALFAATAYEAAGDSLAAAAWYENAVRGLGEQTVARLRPSLVREARGHAGVR